MAGFWRAGKQRMGNRMSDKRILLTGGAGFIGSHVAEALLERGFYLSIIDNLDNFYDPARKKKNLKDIQRIGDFEFLELDICDFGRLRAAVCNMRPDIIIHLAARAGVRPSIEQPSLYERVNVTGTINLLELARELHIDRMIFGSSSSVYGVSQRVPFSEEDPVSRPISPYAATKLAGELMCYTYAHLYGISAVCLRFFTVYGPRQRPDLAIHKFTALMEEGKPISVFGDGSMGRDYTYIDDIVAGVLASMEYRLPSSGAPFDIFNLGNSHPVKLEELIGALEAETGRIAIRTQQSLQPGDVPLTWANIDKSSRLLGYRPQTNLEEGLKRFVKWYRANFH
jgi:UDP-glucuronate 4-epimerase